jgi:AcrR family transcriptional regulator
MAVTARGMSARAAQAERTRQQILETAQRLFAEIGYDATSLQMIADEMGLTKAAVYYYFRAKSDILHETLKPGIERLKTLLDEAALLRGRRARTEHLVNGFVDFLVDNRHYTVMASTEPAAKRDHSDATARAMRLRGMTLLFGEHPAPAERLSFDAAFSTPHSLPNLTDLTDEELREALKTTMLHILQVPSRRTRRRCWD